MLRAVAGRFMRAHHCLDDLIGDIQSSTHSLQDLQPKTKSLTSCNHNGAGNQRGAAADATAGAPAKPGKFAGVLRVGRAPVPNLHRSSGGVLSVR